jgi:hypothetical protein
VKAMKVTELLQELEAETVFEDTAFEFNDAEIESLTNIPTKDRKLKWKFFITLEKFYEDKESPYHKQDYFDFFEIEGQRKTKRKETYTDTGINIHTGEFVQTNPRTFPVYETLKFRGRFYNDYEASQKDRIFERIKYLIGLSFSNAEFILKDVKA